ncbi:MAG TPA: LptA/OstA family protein [Polyangiaceae bacterium]|nr:LptA/OstA family protein [Polyangiaceae bacterium]
MVKLSNNGTRRWLLGSAVAALVAGPAAAPLAQAGPLAVIAGETLDVKADSLEVDMARGTAVLDGKVHASLGDLEVDCAKVEVRYDQAPNVRWAKGTGGVSARAKGFAATAAAFEVDVARRSVRLEGTVRLSRGRGWVTADSATIDLSTKKVVLNDVQGSIPVQTPAR